MQDIQTGRRKSRRPEIDSGSHGCSPVKSYIKFWMTKSGFTLAEVLITLGIIGVVASMTIPNIISVYQDQEFKTSYKKVFSISNQALLGAIGNDEALSALSGSDDGVNACINWTTFSNQFKKTKECINNDNTECWNSTGETSSGTPRPSSPAFIDNSGIAWSMRGICTAGTNNITYFLVDTNGLKKPNIYGKDRFVLKWILDNSTYGLPTKVTPSVNQDYNNGVTNASFCPTGPCYYQKWLLE